MRPIALLCKMMIIVFALSILNCGGGSSSSDSASSSGLGGPNPEDVFDLPNALPDDFRLTSCPPLTGYTSVNDLAVTLSSPDAPRADFDGDGDYDSFVTQFNALTLKTFLLQVQSLSGQAFPPDYVVPRATVPPRVIGGQIFDENGVATNNNSYGDDLCATLDGIFPCDTIVNWTAPYRRPMLNYNVAVGIEFFMNPGVHMFTAYFADINNKTHCAQESFRIIMCPQDGDPISSFLAPYCPPAF